MPCSTIPPHMANLPPSQLSIDALSTITPSLADLLADALSTITPNLADLPPSHSSIDHWMSYGEICNLVYADLVFRHMEISRLYCYCFRSLSLSSLNSLDICYPGVEITLRHIKWQINWFLLLKLIEADAVADLTPPVDLPVHLNGHF